MVALLGAAAPPSDPVALDAQAVANTSAGFDGGLVMLTDGNDTVSGNVSGFNTSASILPLVRHDVDLASTFNFDYHKDTFPLDWRHDGLTLTLALVGLIIAASSGIGGGGILVPLYMLVLKFRPKHAIALSNFTILGGAIANTALNARKKHPQLDRSLIDWDLILIMEPLTIFGAVFGSLLSKILPNVLLTTALVLILGFIGQRTLKKGVEMWNEESRRALQVLPNATGVELVATATPAPSLNGHTIAPIGPTAAGAEGDCETDRPYLELQSDNEWSALPGGSTSRQRAVGFKITSLTVCFVGTCALTVLKGGGNFASPLGFTCGSSGFWVIYFGAVPWVLGFALYFRRLLVSEFEQKVRSGHTFVAGDVQWNSHNTIKYPIYCAVSGLLAGLFGVGGGIVKGPLMLEMGISPSVASASAAAMILFTAAAASTSFIVFGLLHRSYGAMFFIVGFVCTAIGQYSVGRWMKKSNRQSIIVLSIGLVISLSTLCVAANSAVTALSQPMAEFLRNGLRPHGVCTSEV